MDVTITQHLPAQILVFHRGVGQATASGMFISEKVGRSMKFCSAVCILC